MMQLSSGSGGVGFFGVLFIVLLTLKLTGTVDLSWWLVTAPLWGPLTFILVVMVLVFMVALLLALIKK